jgi:hypothetical protein
MEMHSIPEADSLFVDKVLRARRMSPEKKFLLGPRLYESARSIAMAAIRAQHPNASPEEHRHLFQQRLLITRRLEEHPL